MLTLRTTPTLCGMAFGKLDARGGALTSFSRRFVLAEAEISENEQHDDNDPDDVEDVHTLPLLLKLASPVRNRSLLIQAQ
jgi:hypothetical protein